MASAAAVICGWHGGHVGEGKGVKVSPGTSRLDHVVGVAHAGAHALHASGTFSGTGNECLVVFYF